MWIFTTLSWYIAILWLNYGVVASANILCGTGWWEGRSRSWQSPPEKIKEWPTEASVLKAWSANQLHWQHLEACLKCKIVGPLKVAELGPAC